MDQIRLTKSELERLLSDYANVSESQVERLVEVCKDLDSANENDLYKIYNAFCSYLRLGELRIHKMDELNTLYFFNNTETKRLTQNVDMDDIYFTMDIYGATGNVYGYASFNSLNDYLKFRSPFNLANIAKMLVFTFIDDEEGEEDE